jgi:hypothetical protein
MMASLGGGKSVVAGHWNDSGTVRFLSTAHDGKGTTVKRRKVGHQDRIDINAPVAMSDYNKFMHGNDRADQKRTSYSLQKKENKWWKPIFKWLFDSAAINAHLLYQQMFEEEMDRKIFMVLLCRWLCEISEDGLSQKKTAIEELPIVHQHNSILGLKGNMIGNHLLCKSTDVSRELTKGTKRGYCCVHQSFKVKNQVEFYCFGCRRYFHLECYLLYHSKKRIWMQNGVVLGQ